MGGVGGRWLTREGMSPSRVSIFFMGGLTDLWTIPASFSRLSKVAVSVTALIGIKNYEKYFTCLFQRLSKL